MRHHAFGAVVGQRQARAAFGHHLGSALGDSGERVDRDVHGGQEVLAGGVDVAAAQFVLVRETDGVNDEVQLAPFGFEFAEEGVDRIHVRDVARQNEIRAELRGQRADALEQGIALIGERQLGACIGERLGDTPCNRFVIGKAHDEPALALHQL